MGHSEAFGGAGCLLVHSLCQRLRLTKPSALPAPGAHLSPTPAPQAPGSVPAEVAGARPPPLRTWPPRRREPRGTRPRGPSPSASLLGQKPAGRRGQAAGETATPRDWQGCGGGTRRESPALCCRRGSWRPAGARAGRCCRAVLGKPGIRTRIRSPRTEATWAFPHHVSSRPAGLPRPLAGSRAGEGVELTRPAPRWPLPAHLPGSARPVRAAFWSFPHPGGSRGWGGAGSFRARSLRWVLVTSTRPTLKSLR